MSFKIVKVVMLPTNEKAENCIIEDLRGMKSCIYWNQKYLTQDYLKSIERKSHHLYFLSDEEIKEGDWYYNETHEKVFKAKDFNPSLRSIYDHKIIATTDKFVVGWDYKNDIPNGDEYNTFLPKPSKGFIEKYIKMYNQGNAIEEVMVEYGDVKPKSRASLGKLSGDYGKFKLSPKISSNNTITIKPIKDSWNRDEIVDKINKAVNDFIDNDCVVSDRGFKLSNDWIEKNL